MKTYRYDDPLNGSNDNDVWADGRKAGESWATVSFQKLSRVEIVKNEEEVLFIYGKKGAEDEATPRQKQSQ